MALGREFEVIEGRFHDGLGTFAELTLARELLATAGLPSDRLPSSAYEKLVAAAEKMQKAIDELPPGDPRCQVFDNEVSNIVRAAKVGAAELLEQASPARLTTVTHSASEWKDAHAGDLILNFDQHPSLPVSVKTDKSGKAAIAEGQTPDIELKWAQRFFDVSPAEFDEMIGDLGYTSTADLKTHYLNVAELVARVLTTRLGLENCTPTDFAHARATNLEAVRHLLRQLLKYKNGNDESRVIIFDRSTGDVVWESRLDQVDVETLTLDRVSFRPSHPKNGHRIGSEFCLKIDGKGVVTFQIKHRRGKSHGTERATQFGDITTRLLH